MQGAWDSKPDRPKRDIKSQIRIMNVNVGFTFYITFWNNHENNFFFPSSSTKNQVPTQPNHCDCGVYVIEFMYRFLEPWFQKVRVSENEKENIHTVD